MSLRHTKSALSTGTSSHATTPTGSELTVALRTLRAEERDPTSRQRRRREAAPGLHGSRERTHWLASGRRQGVRAGRETPCGCRYCPGGQAANEARCDGVTRWQVLATQTVSERALPWASRWAPQYRVSSLPAKESGPAVGGRAGGQHH